jgi:dipeptide transport system permease protein
MKQMKKLYHTYKAKVALIIFIVIVGLALFAPLIAPYSPFAQMRGDELLGPSLKYLLGTDDLGRDILSRLIYGARPSLLTGLAVVLLSGSLGITLGIIAGTNKDKWSDQIICRLADILMTLPSILLAITVAAILGPGLFNAILAIAIVILPSIVRYSRSLVLKEYNKEYILAAKALGTSKLRLIFCHLLPNIMGALAVQLTLSFSESILSLAALGFLGLGVSAPTAEWGVMLSDSRNYLEAAPHLVYLPGLCLMALILSLNIIGDVLRDVFDPRSL